MTSFGGVRIRAWYAVPAGEPPARGWPVVMQTPGYGGIMPLPLHLVAYGYATLSLYPRGQAESAKEWTIDHDTPVTWNITDKDRYYYRGAYMDCVRGIDFLVSRPEIDSHSIGVYGFSQGGGMTLATAALDQRVGAAVAGVPWLCNFPIMATSTTSPYSEINNYLTKHPRERQAAMATLAYFDNLNLADAIRCPTLVYCAAVDEVHPVRSVLPVFEKIPVLKSLMVYPDLTPRFRADFNNHAKDWMDRYMRAAHGSVQNIQR